MDATTSLSPLLATIPARAELPQPSSDGFRKRQAETTYEALWATCGYISNDPKDPYLCGDEGSCLCQTTQGAMGACFPDGTATSCLYWTTCRDGTLGALQISAGVSATTSQTCDEDRPYCEYLTWTNIDQSAWHCGADEDVTKELAFYSTRYTGTSSEETSSTVGARSSITTKSSSTETQSSSSSVNGLAGPATSSPEAKDDSDALPAGAIAGIVIVAAIIIGAIVWILHHRKTRKENEKRVSTMHCDNNSFAVNNGTTTGPSSFVTPYAKHMDAVEKDVDPARCTAIATFPHSGRYSGNMTLSPSASPPIQHNGHLSLGAVSSLGSQDRLSHGSSSNSRTPLYRAFSSQYVQPSPATSDFPVNQMHSTYEASADQSWLRESRASELPDTAFRHGTLIGELLGSTPEGRK